MFFKKYLYVKSSYANKLSWFSLIHDTFIFQTSQHKLFVKKRESWSFIFFRHQYFCKKAKFVANTYRKKTFSGVCTNFNSFPRETYETRSMKSLLFRCFRLFSDFVKSRHEISILKSILYKNIYPRDFVDKRIK